MKWLIISWVKTDRGRDWLIEPKDAEDRREFEVVFGDSTDFSVQYEEIQKAVDAIGPNREWRAELV